MLALIALSVMRSPFIAAIEDDPTDAASLALRLELEPRPGHRPEAAGAMRTSHPPAVGPVRPARGRRAGWMFRHRGD